MCSFLCNKDGRESFPHLATNLRPPFPLPNDFPSLSLNAFQTLQYRTPAQQAGAHTLILTTPIPNFVKFDALIRRGNNNTPLLRCS